MVSEDKLGQIGLTTSEVSEQARILLTQEFYWSPIEEFSPFGNDDGSDAFQYFREWRIKNKSSSPVNFLNQLLEEWAYPKFDLTTLNETEIVKYLEIKGSGISSDQISTIREHFNKCQNRLEKNLKKKNSNKFWPCPLEVWGELTYTVKIMQ